MDPQATRWIVAVDLSELSSLALQRALTDAKAAGKTEVHVVFALDERGRSDSTRATSWDDTLTAAREKLEPFTRLAQIATKTESVPCFVHIDIGAPADSVLAVADEVGAQQIFAGTHGRRGVQRALLGSVAEILVRRARCPVLVVRPIELAARDPQPEAPDAAGIEREPLETHVYRYSSALRPPSPPGHLL